MSNHQQFSRRHQLVTAGLAIGALVIGSVGLFSPPVMAPVWSPEKVGDVAPVETVAWAGKEQPVSLKNYPTSTGASVTGTQPAQVTNPTSITSVGAAGFAQGLQPLAAPAPANTKGSGDFSATPGVSSGSWGEAGQTGGFTWSYPLTARRAPAGPSPTLSLSYDSSTIDGLTSSTNNQTSTIGDGWSLSGAGSIRQKFAPCMDQGISGSYDLCGATEGQSFTVSFGGRSGQLIKDASTGVYKLQNDDNTKVEYLTTAGTNGTYDGGHWRLTDADGTQFYFGLNKLPGWVAGKATTNSADTVAVGAAKNTQPCWNASFAASLCQQAYAWNLDYVVDLHGNSEAFYYAQDSNNYKSQAGTGVLKSYVRSSRLTKIDYGMRSGRELLDLAPLHVAFDYTGRCTSVDCTKGSDIPTGFACAATGTCTTYSPTFYSDQRLLKVRAETLVAGAYVGADSWNLKHSFPDPGDGTKPALWLGSVDHQGVDPKAGTTGTVSDPATVFSGQTLQNRVWVVDGLAPLDRYRISSIKTVTGASIAVGYTNAECSPSNLPSSPQSNNKRCFPQWWTPTTPSVQAARMDYFHIYPVSSVTTYAGPGGNDSASLVTTYQYLGSPAYKYAAPKYVSGTGGSQLTWSVFAGYGQVKTITGNELGGNNPTSVATYLRGLDGTPTDSAGGLKDTKVTVSNGSAIDDSPWFAGAVVENQSYLGTSATLLNSSISLPWASAPTATGTQATNAAQARHTATGTIVTKSASGQGSSGWLESKTTNTFDSYGRITAVSSTGDTAIAGDESCVISSFADNPAKNLLELNAVTSTYSGECSNGTPTGNVLKASRALYDSSNSAVPGSTGYVAPTVGEVARTDQAKTTGGQTITAWQQGPDMAYDVLGRPTRSTDTNTGTPRITSTSYTPAMGLPTSMTVTNPLGWTKTTTLDVTRGQKLSETDANGNASTFRYDASGRPTAMWDPLRPIANNPTKPSTITSYSISQTAPSWVKTIKQNSAEVPSYTIYDGLGRIKQTQTLSPTGGMIVTDASYNSLGKERFIHNKYYAPVAPNGVLQVPTKAPPSATEYTYDGAGRPTKVTAYKFDNQYLWAAQSTYSGTDTVTTTGPGSQAAQTMVKDINGSLTKTLQYRGTAATGSPDITSYTFDLFKQMIGMKDPAGNNWSWRYDPLGRQIASTDPDTGATSITFDAAGRTLSTTNGLGTTTTNEYDSLDRITTVNIASSGNSAKPLLSKTYDGEKKGQLSSVTRFNGANLDQAVKTSYSSYTADYQPKAVTTELPSALGTLAGSYKIQASYTLTGKLAQQKTPAFGGMPEELIGYGYDGLDQPISVGDSALNTIAGFTQYDSLGFLKYFKQLDTKSANDEPDSTGTTEHSLYWDATTGRLESQQSTNFAHGVTTDLGKTSYTYDEAGKITARENAFVGRPGSPNDYQCYTYDYLNRVSAVWTPSSKQCTGAPTPSSTSVSGLGGVAPYAQTYLYNLSGDRSQVKRFDASGTLAVTDDYSYPAAGGNNPHQLQSVKTTTTSGESTATFGWDAGGRMTDRAGQALSYTLDGKLASTSGSSSLPANANPNSAGGTGPAAADPNSQNGSRFYDGDGNLVGIVDGSGTTAMLGSITAHATPGGALTATKSYSFAGKTVAQRTTVNGVTKLVFIIGDSVNTAQTLVNPTIGTGPISTLTRFTDPFGLARGSSQVANGNGAFAVAPVGALGVGSNAANQSGFGAANGYIGGLTDTGSSLTHLGARDLDPVTGIFINPDPLLDTTKARNYSPYTYAEGDPVNASDPSGLSVARAMCDICGGGGSGTSKTNTLTYRPVPFAPIWNPYDGYTRDSGLSGGGYSSQVDTTTSQFNLKNGVYSPKSLGFNTNSVSTPSSTPYDDRPLIMAKYLLFGAGFIGCGAVSAGACIAGGILIGAGAGAIDTKLTNKTATWEDYLKAGGSGAAMGAIPFVGKLKPMTALEAAWRVSPWAGPSISRVTTTPEVFFRVWGGESGKAGRWLTPIQPITAAWAKQSLALPAENTSEFVSLVVVPPGTRIQVGTANPAFGQLGGGPQVQLIDEIPTGNFGPGIPLK